MEMTQPVGWPPSGRNLGQAQQVRQHLVGGLWVQMKLRLRLLEVGLGQTPMIIQAAQIIC